MSAIHTAIELLKAKSIEKPKCVPAPTKVQVSQAEAELGFTFPPSFLVFLSRAGNYTLPYWQTYWVGDDSLSHRNIITANVSEQTEAASPLPSFLVSFHNNGCGDQLCFDTRKPDKRGEYPVVFWDHELTPEENLQNLTTVAYDFSEWLIRETENS